jgi:dienelactone hydrolase
MKLSVWLLVAGLFLLFVGGCLDSTTDDSMSDGDLVADGDRADGDQNEDGDATVDGDEPVDGDELDGDAVDGDATDGEVDLVDGDQVVDGDADNAPILPLGACGMASYDLLPRQDVGHLLSYEENPFFDLSSTSLDALLSAAGYTALSPVPYGSRVFRFRYTTQDRGQLVEATAFLAIPANAELPEGERPLVLFGHGTTGFSDPCAPTTSDFEGPAIPALLASQGYVAVAPDYIGMVGFGEASETTHGYLIGEQVAIGSWDALRAGLELIEQELSGEITASSSETIVWGGSQGGHMALFTELYGPYYAPEFNVKGVVAAVPPSVIKPVAEIAVQVKSPPSVSLIPLLVTMRRWYGAPESLDGAFTNDAPYYLADNVESMVFLQEECNGGEGVDWDSVEIADIFTQDLIEKMGNKEWDKLEPWNCYFDENSLATSSVPPLRRVPTLMVYSEDDDLVLTAPMREDFLRLCGLGYNLDYLECANAGHSDGALWSLPEQFAWIKDRITDVELDQQSLCQVHEPVCCSGTPEGRCDAE